MDNDPRIEFDEARAEKLRQEGKPLCERCTGTGNQFLFMYSKCPDCDGTGIAPTAEPLAAA